MLKLSIGCSECGAHEVYAFLGSIRKVYIEGRKIVMDDAPVVSSDQHVFLCLSCLHMWETQGELRENLKKQGVLS